MERSWLPSIKKWVPLRDDATLRKSGARPNEKSPTWITVSDGDTTLLCREISDASISSIVENGRP